MDVNSVVKKALTNKAYAKRLRKAAAAAKKKGVGSKEHKALLRYFKASPKELSTMYPPTTANTCGWLTNEGVPAVADALDAATTGDCMNK